MSLTQRVFRRGLGLGGLRLVTYVLQFGVQILLARLLDPRAFGILALSSALLLVLTLASRWGIVEALVSSPDIDGLYSTIFWIRLGYVVLMLVAAVPFALALDLFYEPVVSLVVLALVAGTALNLLGGVFRASMQADVRLVGIGVVDLLATLAAGGFSLYLVLEGWGIWGLVSYYVSRQILRTLGYAVLTPQYPALTYSKEAASWFKSHAFGMVRTEALGSVQTKGDDFLIGTVGTAHVLGIYSIAWRIMSVFKTVSQGAINTAMKPLFGALADDAERSKRNLEFLLRTQLTVVTLVYVGTVLVAPEFVRLVFGEQWVQAIPTLQILTIAGVLFPVTATCQHFYYSRGDPDTVLSIQLRYLPVLLGGIALLVPLFGEIGAAVAVDAMVLVKAGYYYRHLGSDVDLNLGEVVSRRFVPPVVTLGLGHLVRQALLEQGVSDVAVFFGVGVFTVATYALVLLVSDTSQVRRDVATINRTLIG